MAFSFIEKPHLAFYKVAYRTKQIPLKEEAITKMPSFRRVM